MDEKRCNCLTFDGFSLAQTILINLRIVLQTGRLCGCLRFLALFDIDIELQVIAFIGQLPMYK